MVPWTHENIVWKRWRTLIVGAKVSQDPIDELLWMALLYYTQLYIEFSWKINQISERIHKTGHPLGLNYFLHRESITQWYHIPAYQAFISLYMCDFAHVPVAGNMCLTFNIMTAMASMLGGLQVHLNNRCTVVFMCRDIPEFTKKLSCVTPIPTWKLNRIEIRSASDYIVTMFLLTLPWSPLRYQDPSEGGHCVTKIAPMSYQDLRYFLYINLLQFCQILSQIRVSHRNNN